MVRIVLFPRVKPFFCRANKYMSEKKCLFDYLFKNGCNKILLLQSKKFSNSFNRGKISSVSRALDCRAGGRGFNSRGRTNTQVLKTTEK